MRIEKVMIDKVIPYARNPRKNDAAVAKTAASICALEDFSYIVILALSGKHYRLITAYNIKYKNRRDRLRKEYEDFLRQKKEGSAS